MGTSGLLVIDQHLLPRGRASVDWMTAASQKPGCKILLLHERSSRMRLKWRQLACMTSWSDGNKISRSTTIKIWLPLSHETLG
jgi:hypothetical protein